ncbi:MAG: carboxypeptidase regulatory-like domain-containing protein [Muribaculaceae bacterium]|nr:carboxypeptidase regulatory-like domain-containing protein [Muribaculaceae bacterium]
MRIHLTIAMLLAMVFPALAATGLRGTVVDKVSGKPVADANILLQGQELFTTSDASGQFQINNANSGNDLLKIIAYGFDEYTQDVHLLNGQITDLGTIRLETSSYEGMHESDNYIFDSEQISDDDGMQQGVGTIQGATDDVFFQLANYNFSVKRYRFRGYADNWASGYINGVKFNDQMRGNFSYSGLGGMTSSAFRSKESEIGLTPSTYGFGSIGGSTNFTTYASEYAPGFRGNLSYTNSNYMLRAMLQYSTGVNRNGWAFSASVIGRYAPEGVVEGTFYDSFGYSLSLQKIFNEHHSINISTWGAPTLRAGSNAITQEAADLAGSNLYNPDWGWLNGKKVSDRVYRSFDPSAIVNWIWKPRQGTQLNTAVAFRSNMYDRTTLDWFNAADPRPTYYQNMPSYWKPTVTPDEDPTTINSQIYAAQLSQYEQLLNLWRTNEATRQINWDAMYQANLLNADGYNGDATQAGRANYIIARQHSNVYSWMLNSNLNHRLSEIMTLQAGVSFNYARGHYFKSVHDLLGANYWLDIDNFSVRDFNGNQDILQNNMKDPNRRATIGDTYGYDYFINKYTGRGWYQNEIKTSHWDVNYAAEVSYTSFFRKGMMQNGRAPENSYGKGKTHSFFNFGLKAGATYKIDGRNYFTANVGYGTRAPEPNDAYINSQIKDTAVPDLKSESYFSADLSYTINYAKFRGSITGFYTMIDNSTKHNFFYDYDLSSMMAYAMSGVKTEYKGVEIGVKYNIWNGISVSGAAMISSYLYKNDPIGVRNANNGAIDDVYKRTYLKNYHVGGAPQQAYCLALNWAAPKQWFFEINANYFCDGYVDLAPTRHEQMPGLWKFCTSEEEYNQRMAEITHQDKLKDAFVMNLSIGKLIYTHFGALNFNLSVNNLLNNRNIQTGGFQESKFDYTNYTTTKFPNRYWYAQGIRVFFNFGIRF